MSQWTHVSATIRFDALRLPGFPHTPPQLGNVCSFESPEAAWDSCDVPCGSEGSLSHQMWTNPERNDLVAYTAMIWGDLRDYEDADEVVAYLTRICAGQMVRQGVAEIAIEYRDPIILRFDNGAWVRCGPTPPADRDAAVLNPQGSDSALATDGKPS